MQNTVTNTVGTGYHNVATVSSGRSDPESFNHQAPAATPVSLCLGESSRGRATPESVRAKHPASAPMTDLRRLDNDLTDLRCAGRVRITPTSGEPGNLTRT